MAKQPPEVYSPGELDKIRKNLGSISPEEAKRVASLLGGEIGIEKSPQIVKKSYQKTSRGAPSGQLSREGAGASGDADPKKKPESGATPSEEKTVLAPRVSYIDRMRKNFLASRKEYRLKSLPHSILGLLPFLRLPDTIHPRFILESRKRLMEPLEEFVIAVRKIFSLKDEDFFKAVSQNELYLKVVRTLCAWDTECIHRELSKLRLKPDSVEFSDCVKIIQALYRPFVILNRLSHDDQIRKAIEFCSHHHLLHAPVEGRSELKTTADSAVSLLPRIFFEIRQSCYPILLKNIDVAYYEYADFFDGIPEAAMLFFNLTPENVLNPEAEAKSDGEEPPKTHEPETGDEATDFPADEKNDAGKPVDGAGPVPDETAPEAGDRESAAAHAVIPQEARKGMENLDRLFPENGLLNLENKPDLYALLQKTFPPLHGLDMVPDGDPLIQIVFLHRILNELFYGFRAIEFGSSTEGGMIEDVIEPILDNWPYFTGEIIEKQYFPRLTELQRQSERNPEFLRSEFGRKLNADLKWTRRLYLLPFQEIESAVGMRRAAKIPDAPVLSETLSALKAILTDMTTDMERTLATLKEQGVPHSGEFNCATIHNPWSKYKFEIENPVSIRLSKLLVKKVKTPDGGVKIKDLRNNANLVSVTASIVELFEYLVNSKDSYFYRDQPVWLFKRSAEPGSSSDGSQGTPAGES